MAQHAPRALQDGFAVKGYVRPGLGKKGVVKWMMVGREEDVEIASYLYTYLTGEIDRLTKAATKAQQPRPFNPKAWAYAFRIGAVSIIHERLKAARRETLAEANQSTALMRIAQHDDALLAYMAAKGLKKGRRTSFKDGDGFAHGRDAGRNIRLTREKAQLT